MKRKPKMPNRVKCLSRIWIATKEDKATMSNMEIQMKEQAVASLRCKDCSLLETCPHVRLAKLQFKRREDERERKPKGVHICVPRQQHTPEYTCESCLGEYQHRFQECEHRSLNKTQTTLDGQPEYRDVKLEEIA